MDDIFTWRGVPLPNLTDDDLETAFASITEPEIYMHAPDGACRAVIREVAKRDVKRRSFAQGSPGHGEPLGR